ncbi:MAG: carboxymuconolactone decarboxylase family protein [Ignavibacteriales bacterium]|nr:carboxymuconolactone decarboxylase family protein [Ignavibacteriales bacterium]
MAQLPKRFQQFHRDYPNVAHAYEKLGDEVHDAGSLDDKTRALIKIALSTGAQLEGALHSHVRKVLAVNVSPAEIRHAILLSLPTIGFPSMMAALSWAEETLARATKKKSNYKK